MIALLLDDAARAYEQDIRELCMAFFPGEPFCYEERPEAGLFLCAENRCLFLSHGSVCGRQEAIDDRMSVPSTVKTSYEKTAAIDFPCEAMSEETKKQRGISPIGSVHYELSGTRSENKSAIKRALYEILSAYTGRQLSWGTLTGIRPVRLFEQKLMAGLSDEETIASLRQKYLISEEKAGLAMRIAHAEQEALSRISYRDGFSLYIGIPFCPTTCLYCSFTSYPMAKWAERVPEYLACLRREFRQVREAQQTEGSVLSGKTLQTIYVGGGTPTALSADALSELLGMTEKELDLSGLAEWTVEAGRPDSITEEKLAVLKQHGIGRISINPQTMNQKTLDLIGRRHTTDDVKRAFFMAREAGFQNINMDIIMGLPEETADDVRHTLAEIEAMHPDSLTVHALAVKRAARLNISGNAWANLRRADGEEAAAMMALAADSAARLRLSPYYLYRQKNMAGNQENTGYAAPGKENLYNILMMEELHTVAGIGAGASTKAVLENADPDRYGGSRFRVERAENIKNIAEYLPRFDEVLEKKQKFLYGVGETSPSAAKKRQ